MNTEHRYLLRCLRGFVIGKNPGPYAGSWNALIELARRNSVSGILGYMITRYETNAPKRVKAYLREQTEASMAFFSQRAQDMERLINAMNTEQIDHLPLKGYVVRNCYPVPELRTFGDIDFVIREEDRVRSDALMKRLEFKVSENWEPVFSYKKGREYYEIHTRAIDTNPTEESILSTYYSDIWQKAQHVVNHSWQLMPEDHLIYLIVHIAKHLRGSGAGIRMYLDIAFWLERYGAQMDWIYIGNELEKLNLKAFANTVFVVASTVLGAFEPPGLNAMAKELLIEFMEFTLSGGTFGFADKPDGVVTLKKAADGGDTSRSRVVLKRLFPSAESIESRYAYLKGRHWLLPFAWVHRFFRTLGSLPMHVMEAKGILTADEEQVKRVNQLSHKIGLS